MKKTMWAEFHRRNSHGSWTPFLIAASWVYRFGLAARRSVTPKRLPGFVLSVGNLVAGGTGKTPAVAMLARWAVERGYETAVLTRGYRGSYGKKDVLEVSDGSGLLPDAGSAGDEPRMLGESLPGVPVIAARKRYEAGIHAHRRFGSTFFILDDGFQHLALGRDLDLVLVDATCPWGNGHLLPRGPLREPIRELKRADAVILTRAGVGDNGKATLDSLRARGFSGPVFTADHQPVCVLDAEGTEYDPGVLHGRRVAAFAGIGDPDSFRLTLERLGAHVVKFDSFPDHHVFSAGELDGLERGRMKTGAEYLMTTEKDRARLRNAGRPVPDSMRFLRVAFSLMPGSEGLLTMITERLEVRHKNSGPGLIR